MKPLNYKKQIIAELSFGKHLPALDITHQIEKSLPLTNKILAELVQEGILKEDGFALSTGGRRPVTYSIVKNKFYVLSVAMDQYITKIGLLDLHDSEFSNLEKFDLPLINNENALDQLAAFINRYLDKNVPEQDKILGIGIGMPGFVDVKNGVNYSFFTTAQKKHINLIEYLQEKTGFPVNIDNDSSVVALTEQTMGPARKKMDSLVINFGWGVGLGMILNGQLFRGHNGFAGEFSHIPIFNNNKLCDCGKSGCLETEASLMIILSRVKELINEGRATSLHDIPDDLEEASDKIISAALAGDQLAVEVISQNAYDIGRGIAILIHILNPEQIIVSGRGSAAGSILLAPIYQAINKYCIPRLASYTQILISSLGKYSELYGAAVLVTENIELKRFAEFFKSEGVI